ncbi:hypothetical protein JCM6882_008951 [Rhodosporidiobolus microsporus]
MAASYAPLSELVLSSTHSASPLPTISLHNPTTGALVYSFRSPVASTSTSAALSSTRGKQQEEGEASLRDRRTFAVVEGGRGVGGVLLGLGGKDGRAGVNVWNFTRETTQHRLIPPVRLSTMATSKDGAYMAGGTPDGRLFLWEISSGSLLITVDAHYRAVSALAFSDDGAALVSGSEDATVSVWSIGRLLNSTPMNPPTPFATLSDHTLPVTDLAVGVGAFPKCRVITASLDSTVKIWDISTSPPSLLSTFSFPTPISHVALDPLERFFFAAGPSPSASSSTASSAAPAEPAAASSRVIRVNLYQKKTDEFGIESVEQVGGLGRGEVERVGQNLGEGEVYEIPETITALTLSSHSPALLLGTSTTSIHILSLPSLLPSRIIPPPPSSTSPGPITFLTSLLRPPELGSSAATAGGAPAVCERQIMPQGMGRTVLNPGERERGGKGGRVVEMRIGAAGAGLDLDALISPATGLSSLPSASSLFGRSGAAASAGSAGAGGGGAAAAAQEALERERRKAQELEREVEVLRRQLGRANAVNEGMWKRVVEGTLGGAAQQ